MEFTFQTVAITHSPYKQKFAIPRQSGIVSHAKGTIELVADTNHIDLLRGIEQFSHLWLLFIFHGTQENGWKPLVRPPRLGGNTKLGVFASRSTFRPNPIGMSVVKLEGIEEKNNRVLLHVSGLDLLDKTPIIDIKPYIPYSDAIMDAKAGFAQTSPISAFDVIYSLEAENSLKEFEVLYPSLRVFINEVLIQDPRPAYKNRKKDEKIYAMTLYNLKIQWRLQTDHLLEVIAISMLES